MDDRNNNTPNYGPDNPHPLSRMKTELVWEGKYDEYGNRRPIRLPSSPLPLQRIETIDEPHDREKAMTQLGLFDEAAFAQKAHHDDFRNMLIWGDNKLALAALLERFRGKVDLIYIDPPFDVGADFTMQVQLGDGNEALEKEQSILEAVAYRDTWGKGTDSYLHMMYERLTLMRNLLSERGSIYVHVDDTIGHYMKIILDEIFRKEFFQSQVIWQRVTAHSDRQGFGMNHDMILNYSKTSSFAWNTQYTPLDESYIKSHYTQIDEKGRRFRWDNATAAGVGPARVFFGKELTPPRGTHWRWSQEKIDELIKEGRIALTSKGKPQYRRYLDENIGKVVQSVWVDISPVNSQAHESTSYNTQKPETLLERIIKASSNEGSLVLDCFCGSGTTLAVTEKLGRRWIGVDLGRYAIHTTRKRLIQVQRDLHAKGQPYRSFDVYNLGRYERQWWQFDRLNGYDEEHRNLVLRFYKAAPLQSTPHPLLHGSRSGALIHIDQIDSIFTFDNLYAAAQAAQAAGARELHCLAWEFEMELALKKQAVEVETGIPIRLKYIPREIMEANRIEAQFFEAGYLEAQAVWYTQDTSETERRETNHKLDVELVRFIPSLAEAPEKEMAALRERAVRSPFDFIDFWAVDFTWHDGKPFEHHWQDFRTRKDRSLKTRSDIVWSYAGKGNHQICVKVIDVFGVDTTTVLDIEI